MPTVQGNSAHSPSTGGASRSGENNQGGSPARNLRQRPPQRPRANTPVATMRDTLKGNGKKLFGSGTAIFAAGIHGRSVPTAQIGMVLQAAGGASYIAGMTLDPFVPNPAPNNNGTVQRHIGDDNV